MDQVIKSEYQNPVWPGYFADPYVVRMHGRYFAFGTGATPMQADRRIFEALESTDLIHWTSLGGVLEPIDGMAAYWAPEAVEWHSIFHLFFSAGDGKTDATHRIRVATAAHPSGPYQDSGRELMPDQGFSIDPNPFFDPQSRQWYLYFGMDFTADEPFGTGLAVVQLSDDLMSVAGAPQSILRASKSWQIYERNRDYKGRIWPTWNTVEGPFVVFHGGRYWLFYSGGRWSGDQYGVGAAVADHPMGPFTDIAQHDAPGVLRAVPEQVIGPGHNSAVLAPDGKTWVAVYHAWNVPRTQRQMRIDPIHWTSTGPICDGPSITQRNLYQPLSRLVEGH